jgi:hypothetical protein
MIREMIRETTYLCFTPAAFFTDPVDFTLEPPMTRQLHDSVEHEYGQGLKLT